MSVENESQDSGSQELCDLRRGVFVGKISEQHIQMTVQLANKKIILHFLMYILMLACFNKELPGQIMSF